jgi:hypothetical protein
MMEKMVHTAKQTVKATVLAMSARFCCEEVAVVTLVRSLGG